jgi:hypothetical protein
MASAFAASKRTGRDLLLLMNGYLLSAYRNEACAAVHAVPHSVTTVLQTPATRPPKTHSLEWEVLCLRAPERAYRRRWWNEPSQTESIRIGDYEIAVGAVVFVEG